MNVADFLSSMHSPKLTRVEITSQHGMHEWLSSGTFIPAVSGADLCLSSFSIDQLLANWANDTARLLVAAHDTLYAIAEVKDKPKSTAWILIKAYYAAFYYAHVALRLTKTSLTYMQTTNLLKIRSLLDAYGINHPFRLTTNQYIINFSEIGPAITLSQKSGGDGTHQNTWSEMKLLVDNCKAINLGKISEPGEKSGIDSVSDTLSTVILKSGSSGKSLSEIRNDIQYRQLHGVWPPYGSSLKGDYCLRKFAEIKSNDTSINSFDISHSDSATSFLNSCFLICWSVEKFIESIASSSSKSFLKGKNLRL